MEQSTVQATGWAATDAAVQAPYRADSNGTGTETFDQAMQRAQAEEARTTSAASRAEAGATATDDDLPVEAFALPSWYGDYIPKQWVISPEIDRAYWALAKKLSADGGLDDEDRQRLRTYLDNDPHHRQELSNEAFRRQYRVEIEEYTSLLDNCFHEALDAQGITTQRQYYEDLLLNDSTSEAVHQTVHARLTQNPRARELMAVLGIEV